MDEELLFQYPGLDNVASFLGATAETHYREFGEYKPFDDLGIGTEEEFVQLIEWGNLDAIRRYERLKDILNF